MPPSALAQRRTHNILLFQKLLNLRDGASPFTLLLDTLEQTARPVLKEFMIRAKTSKSRIIFVSFRSLRKPKLADVFIKARGKTLQALTQEIVSHLQPATAAATSKSLVIIDTLNVLSYTSAPQLPSFLSSFLNPTTSLIAVYHTDVPESASTSSPYAPSTLRTLLYLATAILAITSLSHVITKKKARDRSLEEPGSGISEGKEGVLVGLKRDHLDGVVVEMEIRRKSGRGVKEVFVLSTSETKSTEEFRPRAGPGQDKSICLLEDHPAYSPKSAEADNEGEAGEEDEVPESTFNLGLTEKQRKDREGVVLPYFDAQKGDGPGEGGRILYEMGREDDWDPEEDEI